MADLPGHEPTEGALRALSDRVSSLVWMADADGARTWFNDGWLAFTGRALADELGDGWADRLHPGDRPRVLESYRVALTRGAPWETHHRLRRADGEYRWLLARGYPVGGAGVYVGECTDITDWWRAGAGVESERALLDAVVQQLPAGVVIVDAAGRLIRSNQAADELLGPSVHGRAVRRGDGTPYEPDDLPAVRAARTGRTIPPSEYGVRRSDGSAATFVASAAPVHDEWGAVVSAVTVFVDVSDRKAAERERARLYDRLSRLQAITVALSEASTPGQVVEVVLSEVVPAIGGQAGMAALLDASGDTLEVVGGVGYGRKTLAELAQCKVTDPLPMADAVRGGELVVLEAREQVTAEYPVLGGLAEMAPYEALVAVPLVAGERTLGGLVISFLDARTFDHGEVAFLQAIADQCGQALDRAQLYAAEAVARAEAVAANDRLRFLAKASEVLNASLDLDETLEQLAVLAVPRLADCCVVHLLQDQGPPRPALINDIDPVHERRQREMLVRYPVRPDARAGMGTVLRTGHPQMFEATDEFLCEIAVDGEHLRLLRELDYGTLMLVPLTARGQVLGGLVLANRPGRGASTTHFALAVEFAARAATAVDHARLFTDRSNIARSLQDSLLPPSLPEPPGLQLGAEYVPAGTGADVGGDFYDVFATGRGSWLCVVGDVRGKGIEAAAVTGLVRHTIRAVALASVAPSDILRQVNEVLLRQDAQSPPSANELPVPQFATACLVEVTTDDAGARLVVCSAGHPLPLVLRADGGVEEIGAPGALVGVLPLPGLTDVSARLSAGDALVLFTDGITERHDHGRFFDDAIRGVLSSALGLGARALARHIRRHAEAFVASPPADDMAVVTIRVPSPGDPAVAREIVLPATAYSPGRARRFIVEAAISLGCHELAEPAELLTSELVTNAVLHAGTGVRLRLAYGPDGLRVEITDLSAALPDPQHPVPEATSGRGLLLVDSLADRWGVDPSPAGKTVWFELRV